MTGLVTLAAVLTGLLTLGFIVTGIIQQRRGTGGSVKAVLGLTLLSLLTAGFTVWQLVLSWPQVPW